MPRSFLRNVVCLLAVVFLVGAVVRHGKGTLVVGAVGRVETRELAHKGCVTSLTFVGKDQALVSTGQSGDIYIWDNKTDRPVKEITGFPSERPVRVARGSTLNALCVFGWHGALSVFDCTNRPLNIAHIQCGEDLRVSRSKSGLVSVIGLDDKAVRRCTIFELTENGLETVSQFDDSKFQPEVVAFSHKVSSVYLCGDARSDEIVEWDYKTHAVRNRIRSDDPVAHRFASLALSPDDKHLVTTTTAGRILIWDTNTKSIVKVLERAMPGSVEHYTEFSRDGRTLFSAFASGEEHRASAAKLWSVPEWTQVVDIIKELPVDYSQQGSITSACMAEDGRTVAIGDNNGRIHLWRRATTAE